MLSAGNSASLGEVVTGVALHCCTVLNYPVSKLEVWKSTVFRHEDAPQAEGRLLLHPYTAGRDYLDRMEHSFSQSYGGAATFRAYQL